MEDFSKELEEFLKKKIRKEINIDRLDAYQAVQWFVMDYKIREGGKKSGV